MLIFDCNRNMKLKYFIIVEQVLFNNQVFLMKLHSTKQYHFNYFTPTANFNISSFIHSFQEKIWILPLSRKKQYQFQRAHHIYESCSYNYAIFSKAYPRVLYIRISVSIPAESNYRLRVYARVTSIFIFIIGEGNARRKSRTVPYKTQQVIVALKKKKKTLFFSPSNVNACELFVLSA